MKKALAIVLCAATFLISGGIPACATGDTAVPNEVVIGEIGMGRMEFNGISRVFNYYIPSTFNGKRMPVVVDIHGSGYNALSHFQLTNIIEIAEREGFIVIGPNAVVIHNTANSASMAMATYGKFSSEGYDSVPGVAADAMRFNASSLYYGLTNVEYNGVTYNFDDVGYILALVDLFINQGYGDTNRVFAQGLSSGACMALRLAHDAADRFAGVTSVAGLLLYEYNEVVPADSVKLIFIHSANDPIVPPGGMSYNTTLFPAFKPTNGKFAFSLDDSIAWFMNAYYGTTPVQTGGPVIIPNVTADARVMTRTEYNDGAVIKYYTTNPGAGHSWPGSNMTVGSIVQMQATELIWADMKIDLISETASACVNKLNGNRNELVVSVTKVYDNGKQEVVTAKYLINNNAAGTYQVDDYRVFVDTKGNTQIRECYIVG